MDAERLNHKELAIRLRVQPSTIRAWQRQGMPYMPCGRLRFYNFHDVQQWLIEREAVRKAKME